MKLETEPPQTAVALSYDAKNGDDAPKVLAAGQGFVAEEIRRRARQNAIPERRDPTLAQSLATLDIGAQIPPELFQAVAEVLAFVYKLQVKK